MRVVLVAFIVAVSCLTAIETALAKNEYLNKNLIIRIAIHSAAIRKTAIKTPCFTKQGCAKPGGVDSQKTAAPAPASG